MEMAYAYGYLPGGLFAVLAWLDARRWLGKGLTVAESSLLPLIPSHP